MVRVSRSAEAIPLLVPNDALRRDEARAGAGPARGRRGAGEQSGSRSVLVATLLLCVSGAVMYAASSSLAAEERQHERAALGDPRDDPDEARAEYASELRGLLDGFLRPDACVGPG